MKNETWHKYLIFILFCVAVYFPLFLHLDWEPVNSWDESLFAMRAGYMADTGEYLRDYSYWLENGPQHRSTKPPFTLWIQVLFVKIFGLTELALRLPSALAALGIVLLMVWFFRKEFRNTWPGYCAGFALVTTIGFVRAHGSRTGDHDAAMSLYMLTGALAFYKYIAATTAALRNRWLVLLTCSMIAAVMTKYVFGLFYLPAFFLYALYKRQVVAILQRGSTWLAAITVLAAIGGWLAVMEWRLPGFVRQAFMHEMVDRYTTPYAAHEHPFGFYFVRMWKSRFMPWLYLVPLPLAMFFIEKFRPWKDIILLMFLCAATLLLTVSLSETKTDHYDLVAYAPLSMLVGIGLYQLIRATAWWYQEPQWRPFAITSTISLGALLCILPYKTMIDRVYKPHIHIAVDQYGYLFRKLEQHHPTWKSFKVLQTGFDAQAIFYAGLFNRYNDYDITTLSNPKDILTGDTVMVCHKKLARKLNDRFELKWIETAENCFLAVTGEPKPPLPDTGK